MPPNPNPAPLVDEGYWPPGNSFVLPDHRMVYISTTKVACSSLRWMVADLAGEDFDRFYAAPGDHQTRLMTIHAARSIWQHSPQIKQVPLDQRAEISRDNGWLVFAVVRDPWSRLWSAWQSKFLVRHAAYVANYGHEPWFPRVPRTPEDILADWTRFVQLCPWESDPRLRRDPHFMPQVDSVHPAGVNYTRIYDLHDLDSLLTDIHEHLVRVGRDQQLYLPSMNRSPIRLRPEVLDAGIADVIERSYRRDFDAFGDRWNLATVRTADEPWTMDAVQGVEYHGIANQRIGDLSAEVKTAQRELRATQKRAVRAESELARVRAVMSKPVRALVWRAVGRARRYVRRARRRERAGPG